LEKALKKGVEIGKIDCAAQGNRQHVGLKGLVLLLHFRVPGRGNGRDAAHRLEPDHHPGVIAIAAHRGIPGVGQFDLSAQLGGGQKLRYKEQAQGDVTQALLPAVFRGNQIRLLTRAGQKRGVPIPSRDREGAVPGTNSVSAASNFPGWNRPLLFSTRRAGMSLGAAV